jgi:hypothetical protein
MISEALQIHKDLFRSIDIHARTAPSELNMILKLCEFLIISVDLHISMLGVYPQSVAQ